MTKNLNIEIEKVLNEIRPLLQSHGGDIELVKFDVPNKTVQVRLTGGCAACPMASLTLQNLVEQNLKNHLPEIKKVEAIWN